MVSLIYAYHNFIALTAFSLTISFSIGASASRPFYNIVFQLFVFHTSRLMTTYRNEHMEPCSFRYFPYYINSKPP
jgi:hypothetical protein